MDREDLIRGKSKGKPDYGQLSVHSRNASKEPSATKAF